MKNKILMLLQGTFPPDIRLEKEIISLSKAGYRVLVVCNQYNKSLNPEFKYCEIRRVKAIFNSVKINRIINLPVIFNIRYLIIIINNIILFKPDFIHAHDLPMMPFAILFKWLLRTPVIFDMHENYPAALKFFDKKGLISFVFKNPNLASVLEKLCLKWSDKIIVVVEENKYRLLKLAVDENKISIVSNTVDLEQLHTEVEQASEWKTENDELSKKIVLLYTGRVSIERGLETAILAMNKLKLRKPDAILLVVGDGEYVNNLSNIVKENDLDEIVKLIKWPEQENLSYYFSVANVCIIPQPQNDFINTTLPHKLFEYMLQKKPVLTSDAIPLKRIIMETNCGLCFISNDPEDFAEAVEKILSSNIPFGDNGFRAVQEKYNWGNDAQVLIKMYKDFETK